MRILTKEEFLNYGPAIIEHLKKSIFIYPTDTIYGIGCDAMNESLIRKIRYLKKRFDMPFSVIAPSKEWIRENCLINKKAEVWIKKLPGPYTLIFSIKNKESIAKNVNLGMDTIGIRIPNNWFSEQVSKIGIPIITTSANISGNDFMTSLDDLDSEISNHVDYVIEEGIIKGKPSTLVFLNKKKVELKKR
ncbi:threonylcarbamoyl-AMP synthase [Candidatus Woesearchaeota archaeon]|jgi:L-threonylcarbamoyladenylate synthase|nr:threonylcarbamoyl-AMP synthase [Candidatus Woesearchaeota archaeon]|tara:strand:+ start:1010 stop:1579 length:570 start_codon:yes stop_codon:yes gene_type:complete